MTGPGEHVTYDWPEGGGAPFDASDDRTRWVLVAGSRFGRTWPSTGLTATGQPPAPPVSDPYQHHVPGVGASEGPWAALDGDGGRRGPDGRWVSHEHDSYAAALAAARSRSDARMLVVRLLQTVNRH